MGEGMEGGGDRHGTVPGRQSVAQFTGGHPPVGEHEHRSDRLSALDAVLDGRDDDAGLARPRARQHAQVTVLMLDDRALRSVGLERRGLRLRPVESDPLGHATSTPHGWDRQPANPARPPGTSPFI